MGDPINFLDKILVNVILKDGEAKPDEDARGHGHVQPPTFDPQVLSHDVEDEQDEQDGEKDDNGDSEIAQFYLNKTHAATASLYWVRKDAWDTSELQLLIY